MTPGRETATGNTTYTARFQAIQKIFQITVYDVAPRTTQTGSDGIAVHTFNVKEGDSVYPEMFGVSDGPIFNANGDYMDSFNEKPTRDTWY